MCRGGVCTLMAWGVISWGMNRQRNKIPIIQVIIEILSTGASPAATPIPIQGKRVHSWHPRCFECPAPVSHVYLSHTLEFPFNPTCVRFPSYQPSSSLSHLLCPPHPHPCHHSLPSFLHCHDLTNWFGNFHYKLSTVTYLFVTCFAVFLIITVEKLEITEK